MPFMEWLLTQRQHPHIGPFATWVWSAQSPVPRNARKLYQVLEHLAEPPLLAWREPCKRAHKHYRATHKRVAA